MTQHSTPTAQHTDLVHPATLEAEVHLDILISQLDPRHVGLELTRINGFVCGIDPQRPDEAVTVFTGPSFFDFLKATKAFRGKDIAVYHPSSEGARLNDLMEKFKISVNCAENGFEARCSQGFYGFAPTPIAALCRCLAQRCTDAHRALAPGLLQD